MPLINPDLSQTGPLEPGTYRSKILEVGFETSSKGNPMIVVKHSLTTPTGEVPRTGYHAITGKGAFMFDQILRAVGFQSEADAYQNPSAANPAFDTDRLVGMELLVQVERTIYQDKPTDSIKSYMKV